MQYSKAVITGFGWQIILKVGIAVLSLIKIFFLSRVLSPQDFGVFALIAVALGLSEAFTQTGINITILQAEKNTKQLINTAWVVAIIRGLVITLLLLLLGGVFENFYPNSNLKALVPLAGVVAIIKGFINPSITLWQKEFAFRSDTLFHLSRHLVETAATVGLGWIWPNVAIFVYGMIVAAIFELTISFVFAKPSPKFRFELDAAKIIWQNARGLSIGAILSYLSENLDDLLIGKLLGTYKLGYYHNGYNMAHKITYEPAKAANYSLISAYTKLNRLPNRQWQGFIKSGAILGLLLLVGLMLLSIFRRELVDLVLGQSWSQVAPILPWLGLAGIIQAMTAFVFTFHIANKNYHVVNLTLLSSIVMMIAGILYFGQIWGLLGASIGLVIARFSAFVPLIVFTLIKRVRSRNYA